MSEHKELETKTLAELYAAQGYSGKAIEIYEHLIIREPSKVEFQYRIQELRAHVAKSVNKPLQCSRTDSLSSAESKRVIVSLEKWLDVIASSRNK